MDNKISTIKLKDLTTHQIIELDFLAFKGKNKSRMTLSQIGRTFLSYVWNIHVCKFNFNEIRQKYISETSNPNISQNEDEFYKYISEYYLDLTEEPREKMLVFLYKAKDDISEIDSHLAYINKSLKHLEDKKKANGWLDGDDRYYRNLLDYYKDKNSSAKEEILNFISNDIDFFTLSHCRKRINDGMGFIMSFFSGDMPYLYSRGLIARQEFDVYNVKNLTELSNKFLDLPSNAYQEIKGLFKNNKDEFYAIAKEYISVGFTENNGLFDKIENLIQTNHIIANRKEILLTIINHYKGRDFISVINMLPMQIEGIFHDICLEIGIDESRLDIASINEKLRIIQSHMNHFIYFEYYSFKFPIIRNIVAHGKLIAGDIEQTAIMLMLDLLPVCELATSEDIPIIKKIKLTNKITLSDFKPLLEYIDYIEIKTPSFYNLDEKENLIKGHFRSEEFWNFITDEIKKEKTDRINNSAIMKF